MIRIVPLILCFIAANGLILPQHFDPKDILDIQQFDPSTLNLQNQLEDKLDDPISSLYHEFIQQFAQQQMEQLKHEPGFEDHSKSMSNPDYPSRFNMTTPEIIAEQGYPIEVHETFTDDGYRLIMHRIPHGRNGPTPGVRTPVLLMHGLMADSSMYVLTGKNRGIAFILADAGYDVWMGNVRSNRYSRGHVNPDITDQQYYNFSFSEHGKYDIPAFVSLIQTTTAQTRMFYVGQSQGTLVFWMALDHNPGLSDVFIAMIAMAPVAKCHRLESPIRILSLIDEELEAYLASRGIYHFTGNDGNDYLAHNFCRPGDSLNALCKFVLGFFSGLNPDQLDDELVPHIIDMTPTWTSVKNILHISQFVNVDSFKYFDYGVEGNLKEYGQPIPPDYDLSKVRMPVYLYYGKNDLFVHLDDVAWLKTQLPNLAGDFLLPDPKFNHLDFIYATDVVDMLYNHVMDTLNRLNPNPV